MAGITNIIDSLPKPAMVLAPMEQVTDAAYRYIIAKYGKPDLMYTEFTSADGLCSVGRPRLAPDLWYDESQRPIFCQLFGRRPETLRQAAEFVAGLGFNGIDINMGCPEKNVVRSGAGAGLIENPELAKDCIRALQSGAPNLPITVKTRIGYGPYDREILIEWVNHLLEVEPAILTLHLRTKKEMSKVPAKWSEAEVAVGVRDKKASQTLIFGNGDVRDCDHARELAAETGVDGVMLGRAIYGNPWLFSKTKRRDELSISERLHVMLEHGCLYERLYENARKFVVMRKHFAEYVSGMPNASELRSRLVHTDSATEAHDCVAEFLDEPFDLEAHLTGEVNAEAIQTIRESVAA
jgi:nifR3 family TIM-barrel protein